MKVMRENPAILQATVASAMKEQNLRNRFNLRIGRVTDSNVPSIEPMEIDHLRPKKRCFKYNKLRHYASYCQSRSYVNAAILNGQHIEPRKLIMHSLLNIASFAINYDIWPETVLLGLTLINAVMPNYPDGGVRRKDSHSPCR